MVRAGAVVVWLTGANGAWAADVCDKAGVVVAPDPVSAEPTARGMVMMARRLGSQEVVHHAWSLLGTPREVSVVTHIWLAGERPWVAPAGWPLELHVEGARPVSLRSRTVTMPTLLEGDPPVTEVSPRFRLDAATARWLAAHPPWRLEGEWDGVRHAYPLSGGVKAKVARLFACAATMGPEKLPELEGVIVEVGR